MSEMVYRVAAALSRLPVRDNSEPGGELDGLRLREAARAAILAMREPTEEMLDGGFAAMDYDDLMSENADYFNKRIAGRVYRAAIDAALNPAPPQGS